MGELYFFGIVQFKSKSLVSSSVSLYGDKQSILKNSATDSAFMHEPKLSEQKSSIKLKIYLYYDKKTNQLTPCNKIKLYNNAWLVLLITFMIQDLVVAHELVKFLFRLQSLK